VFPSITAYIYEDLLSDVFDLYSSSPVLLLVSWSSGFNMACADSITEEKVTVLVADATRMDCQLVSDAIQRHGRFRVIGHLTSSSEIISAVRNQQPDVAVISARLQEGSSAGLRVLQGLRALHVRSRIVMLLDKDERQMVVEAFLHGTRGIFCRVGSSEELRKCVQSIHKGEIWISNAQIEYLVEALAQTPTLRIVKDAGERFLSKREYEIAQLVATGLSNLEVSAKLGLSRHTVKNYLFRIFEKLEISTRIELVLYILSQAEPSDEAADNLAPLVVSSISPDSVHRSARRAIHAPAITSSLVVNRKLPLVS
jgi:DNA-binding NarL/FixJ family response regulator